MCENICINIDLKNAAIWAMKHEHQNKGIYMAFKYILGLLACISLVWYKTASKSSFYFGEMHKTWYFKNLYDSILIL